MKDAKASIEEAIQVLEGACTEDALLRASGRAMGLLGNALVALESEEVVAEVRGFIGVRIPEEVTRKRWLSFVVHQDQHQHALWPKDIPVTVRIVAVKEE